MYYSKQIFKKDSKGKIRVLIVSAQNGVLKQESGIMGGKLVERVSERPGKNIGKANETTSEEQAVLEAKAKIAKKLKSEYFETLHEANTTDVILYMGAKDWQDHKHKIVAGTLLFISRKYDGLRCLAHVEQGKSVKLMSRENTDINEKYNSMNHLIKQLIHLPSGVYDGELFNMEIGTFQKQMKAVKKYRPGISEKIDLNIYDFYHPSYEYSQRRNQIVLNISKVNKNLIPNISIVPQTEYNHVNYANSEKHDVIKRCHDEFVQEGFEGAMVRVSPNYYECNKKSMQLLKVKEFIDEAYKIVDVVPSDADPEIGVVECIMNNTDIANPYFKCGMKFSHEERKEILSNKENYIGKTAEVRFFEYTDDGLPRFPVFHGVRLDK